MAENINSLQWIDVKIFGSEFQGLYIDKTIAAITLIYELKNQTTMIIIALKFIEKVSEFIFQILF